MYTAKRNILKAGFFAKKGDSLPSNPTTDHLFKLGYLGQPKAKKSRKKSTKTHEDK